MGIDQVEIVLCRPKTNANIGSVCRAMKTMGINRLVVVGSPEDYDSAAIAVTAVHAADVWKAARLVDSLEAAAGDAEIVVGTTRRWGTKRNLRRFAPEELADFLAAGTVRRAAIVFGNEESGLSTEELAVCNVVTTIPTSEDFPSLNLSHAVQIVTYALFARLSARDISHSAISYEEADSLADQVVLCLQECGYFRHHDTEFTQRFFRDIWVRAGLGARESKKIRDIFERLPHIARKRFTE